MQTCEEHVASSLPSKVQGVGPQILRNQIGILCEFLQVLVAASVELQSLSVRRLVKHVKQRVTQMVFCLNIDGTYLAEISLDCTEQKLLCSS